MIETRAMHRQGVPSLCRIFLEGRCRQGANCFQAHADTTAVAVLRKQALAQPSCCIAHGVQCVLSGIPIDVTIFIKADDESVLDSLRLSEVAMTNGLRTLISAQCTGASGPAEVYVPISSLCRLHAGHNGSPCCRFEGDCGFVHLCREVLARLKLASALADGLKTPLCDTATPAPAEKAAAPESAAPLPMQLVTSPIAISVPDMAPKPPFEITASTPTARRGQMSSSRLSTSVGVVRTPPITFDPMALASTAPSIKDPQSFPFSMSPFTSRSFSSTPNGVVWRHNPYASTVPQQASSVIET
ncbi:hypothetical protein STCU_03013 [Strigomonas culicis]|nr:hypothetical protein STCU_03013 [Strigomonas culicis]|eukprot:EPY32028.1 hypothetical protein STCU_03013 [Strigomonas culicis]